MSNATKALILKKQAEIKAAETIAAAVLQARQMLATVEHDDPDAVISEIIEAELE